MKKLVLLSSFFPSLLLGFAVFPPSAGAQTTAPNEWTWMGGSSTYTQQGVYGTLGTPAAGNIPGVRESPMTAVGRDGHTWLFGGEGYVTNSGEVWFNDLWEYNPDTKEWTWWSGSSAVSCAAQPCAVSGVYGTMGTPAPENVPGGRTAANSWMDRDGNFWLFGGQGFDSGGGFGYLNDLWMFNTQTHEWTWAGGNSTGGELPHAGIYGTQGTASASNMPGSRTSGSGWTDSQGNFWLFGGGGLDANRNEGLLNDLWMFKPSTGEWTWMAGSSTVPETHGGDEGQPGVYGSIGVAGSGNTPGGRDWAASWTDDSGNFWLFGGLGFDANGVLYDLNDLWKFTPSTMYWTWMGGNSTGGAGGLDQPSVYGTLGVAAVGNTPGGRNSAAGWADVNGNVWLFGGLGVYPSSNSTSAYLNDLWEFVPSTGQWAWMGGSNSAPGSLLGTPGVYGTLGTPSAGNIPGGRLGAATWVDGNGDLWLFGGMGSATEISPGFLDDLWEFDPYANAATPTFSVPSGTYTSAQTVTISDTTTGATIYYTTNGTTPTTGSTQYKNAITVSSTETIQAIAVAVGFGNSAVASATYTINLPDFSVGASCGFSPATVTPSGAAASTTLTVSTSTTTAGLRRGSGPLFPEAALAGVLCWLGWRKRRRWPMVVLVLAAGAVGLGALSGCGGGGSSSGGGGGGSQRQPVTSTVTVTAASASLAHTTTFSLTVN